MLYSVYPLVGLSLRRTVGNGLGTGTITAERYRFVAQPENIFCRADFRYISPVALLMGEPGAEHPVEMSYTCADGAGVDTLAYYRNASAVIAFVMRYMRILPFFRVESELEERSPNTSVRTFRDWQIFITAS